MQFTGVDVGHVFHLAGKTFVPESWTNPFGFFQVNLMGTVNVLEFCRKTGAGITYVSSYLYGEPAWLPVSEEHPLQSYNPYSQSKIIADNTCSFYARNYKVPVTIFRPFNAYGPHQPVRFLIPEIISKVLDPSVKQVEVMDLKPKRDYVYSSDLVEALVLSIGKPHGVFNIGSGYSKSVEEIILLVMQLSGIVKPYFARSVSRPNEIFDLYADISRAREELGWNPAITFEDGIDHCIRAFKTAH
jgi:nucleoside-diphosphate-sugar epimerase